MFFRYQFGINLREYNIVHIYFLFAIKHNNNYFTHKHCIGKTIEREHSKNDDNINNTHII